MGASQTGCGPSPADAHPAGTPVVGIEPIAFALWRAGRGAREFLSFDAGELRAELAPYLPDAPVDEADAEQEQDSDQLGPDEPREQDPLSRMLERLDRLGSLYGGVAAGTRWQRPIRVRNELQAGLDCVLQVDESRWFAPGTTVRVRGGGNSEVGMVVATAAGAVRLLDPVRNGYPARETELECLARRPINLNTAERDVLVAVFQNLKLVGNNERVTRSEANELAGLCVAERPFEGFQDWLERVLLPAGGIVILADGESPAAARAGAEASALTEQGAFLEQDDVVAVYANAQNANDALLEFATAPFCFTSRDVYDIDLRAVVQAPSGLERARGRISQIEHVAPQTELLELWTRQVDFERALRLSGSAPGWITGPIPVSVHDFGGNAEPPPRRRAHLAIDTGEDGSEAAVARTVFPGTDEQGIARPAPERVDEEGQRSGRVLHFDRSQSDLEGVDLADEVRALPPDAGLVGWTDGAGLPRPFSLFMWVKLGAAAGGSLLDAGRAFAGDRVHLRVEAGEVQLRVLDGPGDHPDTPFEEVMEVTFPTDGAGGGPGPDQWFGLSFDVRGNRPDQIDLRVDGFAHTLEDSGFRVERRGLTHLASALGSGDATIRVESTDGFPDRCVLRIGEELIEVRKSGDDRFDATRAETGEEAGFGGRIAREYYRFDNGQNFGLNKQTDYPAGTPVALYGYSLPLQSNVPPNGATLANELGPFSVARVVGANGGEGRPVAVFFDEPGIEADLGRGVDPAEGVVESLTIEPVDGGQTAEEALAGFSEDGGYALMLQRKITWATTDGIDTYIETDPHTPAETKLYGMHVLRYSGKTDTELLVAEFVVSRSELPNLGTEVPQNVQEFLGELDEPKAYVFEYGGLVLDPQELNEQVGSRVYVLPISVPSGGVVDGFLEPLQAANGDDRSEFAQLTRLEEAELTEWIRYDTIATDWLVRDDFTALREVYEVIAGFVPTERDTLPPEDDPPSEPEPPGAEPPIGGPPGGGSGGPPVGGGGGEGTSFSVYEPPPTEPPPAPATAGASPAQTGGSFWFPFVGAAEDDDLPFTRAVSDALEQRGVFGTESHTHPAGTQLLPVFRLELPQAQTLVTDRGWPGRLDAVFLVDGLLTDPGFPAVVHRAFRPSNREKWNWQPGGPLQAVELGPGFVSEEEIEEDAFYVALQEPLGVPLGAGSVGGDPTDTRQVARMTLFPSGELPRGFDQLLLGADAAGNAQGIAAVVDELVFGATEFAQTYLNGDGDLGGAMVLDTDFDAAAGSFSIDPGVLRTARGRIALPPGQSALADLPEDGGLLRIGEELIAYSSYDDVTGDVATMPDGRGFLGSQARAHSIGEAVWFLSDVEVSKLTDGMNAQDHELQLEDADGFPGEGCVLVGEELIHTTYRDGDRLGMPRLSGEPGRADHQGPGLFRGRFGTTPDGYGIGTAVVRFPTRYADRFAPLADAPELHHLTLELAQPDAFVEGVFFTHDDGPTGSVSLVALVRSDPDVPWDATPDRTPGLQRIERARPEEGLAPVGRQTDTLQLRFVHEYAPGAFDPLRGQSHGWKEVPTLQDAGASYVAPGRVLSRRVW